MNEEIIYETVRVRFLEDGDHSRVEEFCIEFLHQGTHVSILLNGIDHTDILRRLLAIESMYRPVKLLAFKLESIFNEAEYNSLPSSMLSGLIGKRNFHTIQLFGDTHIIKEISAISEHLNYNYSPVLFEIEQSTAITFESITRTMKNRLKRKV